MVSPADMAKMQRNETILKIAFIPPSAPPVFIGPILKFALTCLTCKSVFWSVSKNQSLFCSRTCNEVYHRDKKAAKVQLKKDLQLQGKRVAFCLTCKTERALLRSRYCSIECLPDALMVLQEIDHVAAKKAAAAEQQRNILTNSYVPVVEKKFQPRITDKDLRAVRQREPQHDAFDFLCPTPVKKVYRTQEEAEAFIKDAHPNDEYIHPYPCRCGAIHIGH